MEPQTHRPRATLAAALDSTDSAAQHNALVLYPGPVAKKFGDHADFVVMGEMLSAETPQPTGTGSTTTFTCLFEGRNTHERQIQERLREHVKTKRCSNRCSSENEADMSRQRP